MRRPLAFSREGSHRIFNPVFAAIREFPSSLLKAAGLSNGVNTQVPPAWYRNKYLLRIQDEKNNCMYSNA
jgi:hypothetical protein